VLLLGPNERPCLDNRADNPDGFGRTQLKAQRLFRFLVGSFLRLVLAILRSSALLIDLYIPLDAPLSDFFGRLPRLAASAAPAAICCFLDFAGIQKFRGRRSICF
jgi:hypothetical protein